MRHGRIRSRRSRPSSRPSLSLSMRYRTATQHLMSARMAHPSADVIPDGPQGRAGTSCRTAPLLLTSSRTARRAEPGSRRAPRKCRWIPAFAGMTAKRMWRSFAPWSVIVVGARRRAGLPSRAAPNFDVIPDGPQGRAGIQTGAPQVPLDPRFRGDDSKKNVALLAPWSVIVVGARRRAGLPSRTAPNFDVIPDGPQGRAGIQTGASQEPLDPRFRGDDSKKGGAPSSDVIPDGAQRRAGGPQRRRRRAPGFFTAR